MFLGVFMATAFLNVINLSHYETIKPILDQYERPFTVLDFENKGMYACQIASEYETVSVIADRDRELIKLCDKIDNLIFLNKEFTPEELQHLSECEHFDVVVALSVWERFGEDGPRVVDAIVNMASHAFIKRPEGELYHFSADQKYLQRKTWLLPRIKDKYVISSSFQSKTLTKPAWPKGVTTSSWIPGINLLTFKMCNGIYPSKETLKESLEALKDQPHTDWMVNNMVIQGKKIAWVDISDAARQKNGAVKPTFFTPEGLEAHGQLLNLSDSKQVEHHFWNHLVGYPVHKSDRINFLRRFVPASGKVFEIPSASDEWLDIYLGLGARIIACDFFDHVDEERSEKFASERVNFITGTELQHLSDKKTIDGLIDLYKVPDFCMLHHNAEEVPSILKGLSQKIPGLGFRFKMKSLSALEKSLEQLELLGYEWFNFSPQDFPRLGLGTNIHTHVKERWVSAKELLQAIKDFAALESQGELFEGYIYAVTNDSD